MSVTKQPDQQRHLQPQAQSQDVGYVEESEKSAKASASAGVNLNIFGAIAGAFSSKTKKSDDSADQAEDEGKGNVKGVKKTEGVGGEKKAMESREEQARVQGAGAGNMNAMAAGQTEQNARQKRAVEA